MKQRLLFALAGAAFSAALGLSPAHALSPRAAAALQADSLAQKVHFGHRSCELGVYGWHRHVGPYGVRVSCWPRARYQHRCFVDRFGYRHCWW
jgi:hypothetical protein